MTAIPTPFRIAAGLVLAFSLAGPALAAEPIRDFESEAERQRYHALLEEIRCLVCQNQSLESSDASLAQDLRNEVYRLVVVEDRPRDEAVDFLTQRYGDFVLYRPPMRPSTWLLWFGPIGMLLIGAGVGVLIVRQRQRNRPLTTDEHAEARRLLAGDDAQETGEDR